MTGEVDGTGDYDLTSIRVTYDGFCLSVTTTTVLMPYGVWVTTSQLVVKVFFTYFIYFTYETFTTFSTNLTTFLTSGLDTSSGAKTTTGLTTGFGATDYGLGDY